MNFDVDSEGASKCPDDAVTIQSTGWAGLGLAGMQACNQISYNSVLAMLKSKCHIIFSLVAASMEFSEPDNGVELFTIVILKRLACIYNTDNMNSIMAPFIKLLLIKMNQHAKMKMYVKRHV